MFTNKSSKSLVGISPPSSDTGVSPAPLLTVTDAELSWAMDGHPRLYGRVLTTLTSWWVSFPDHSVVTWQHFCMFTVVCNHMATCVLGIHKDIASVYLVCSHMGPVGRASLVPRLLSAGEEPRYNSQSHNNSHQKKSLLTGHWIMSGNVLWFDEKWVHAKIFDLYQYGRCYLADCISYQACFQRLVK